MANKEAGAEASASPSQESPIAEMEADKVEVPVENDNDGGDECGELAVEKSNEELEEDGETNDKEDHSKDAEEGDPSTLPVTTDAKKTHKSDDVENGEKGKKKKFKRKRNKANKKKKKALGAATKSGDAEGAPDDDEENEEMKGLIFMCSAKTKKDCYDYKIFGLPESRKDTVFKIYKGMKLFLYDIDLKLLYGIYKAAGPGGYNIEPNAFKSAFPSQVRFTVVEDCVPLSEDTLKQAIKYRSKNKFDCQLSSEQVQNLIKLFRNVSKKKSPQKRKAEERNDSAKRYRKSGYGHGKIRDRRGKGYVPRGPPPPSHHPAPRYAAPPPPPLPAYGYGGGDYYGREVPGEGYAPDPYGYYRDPAPYRGYPRSSEPYRAPPPRYHY